MADSNAAAKSEWRLGRRVVAYLRWPQAAFAVLLSLLIGASSQALPYLQYLAVDHYLEPRGEPWNTLAVGDRIAGVTSLALLYLALAAVSFGIQLAFANLVVRMGQGVLYRLREDAFAKLQRLPVAYFDRNAVGQTLTRVVSDVEGINQFVSTGLVGVAQSAVMLMAVIGYMLLLNVRLALLALLVIPVLYLLLRLFGAQLRRLQAEVRKRGGARNATLQESLAGMSTLQLHRQEATTREELARLNREWLASEVKSHQWTSAFLPSVDLVTTAGLAVVLWYGGGLAIQNVVSLGVLIAFTQYLRNFFAPLQELSQAIQTLPQALSSAERVFEILDEPETVSDPADAVAVTSLRGEVEFRDVWFSYQPPGGESPKPAEWVLKGVSLKADPGESIAIVGATGAGKTTLISLLCRFYDVTRGEVRVDGVDVRRYLQRDFRRRIGLVLQDAQLFTGTIESNLRMGRTALTIERLTEVCRVVGLHDYIDSLPLKYQTQVKDRGGVLSTGQKQLLAFARALALDPEILLLDEATASVDTASEQQIQAALTRLLAGRTSIIVAHRLSTIRHCNRIVVMKHGEVVEQGSHEELLRKGGYYATLHSLQSENTPAYIAVQ